MLKKGTFWRKGTTLFVWVGALVLCVGMAERKLIGQRCENIVVKINDDSGVRFITRNEIESLVTRGGAEPLLGSRLNEIDLSLVEKRVMQNKLVKSCQAVRDLGNNLVINVEQQVPIARWIDNAPEGQWRKAKGFYVSEEGHYLPLSNRYSAHVMLISGIFFRQMNRLDTPAGIPYMELLRYIRDNEFWRAQINQVIVDKNGEVSLLPTLGNQQIEFGKPENIDSRFKKLKVFYEKVLASDWNRYAKISVKFKDQVVCE